MYVHDVIYYDLPEKDTLLCYIQLICLIENHYIEPTDITYLCSYFDYDTRKILATLQLWLNEGGEEHFYYPYLFAHIVGFFDLIQQPKSLYEFMDRLQGLDTKKQDLCKQYYFDAVLDAEEEEEAAELETLCNLMETASFTDAYIDLTERQKHQVNSCIEISRFYTNLIP